MQTITEEQFNAISGHIADMEAVENQRRDMRPLLDEVRQFIPDAAYYYRMKSETSFRDIQICFVRNGINFRIYKFDKHYYIAPDMSAFENVETRYGWPAELNGCKIPNRIGVLSARKVAEQIEYETAKYRYFEQKNAERKRAIDEFLKAAEGEPVKWHFKTIGRIERNGVILKFDFSSGVLRTELEIVNPFNVGLDVFKKLADSRLFITK